MLPMIALAVLAHAEAPAPVPASAAANLPVAEALARYDAIRLALCEDRLEEARSAAGGLSSDGGLAAPAAALVAAADMNAARAAFAELSRALVLRLASGPAPKVSVYHCPMWEGYAWWVQRKAGIANPYMGHAMPECGEELSLKAAVKAASP
jgi:hypothetical protein